MSAGFFAFLSVIGGIIIIVLMIVFEWDATITAIVFIATIFLPVIIYNILMNYRIKAHKGELSVDTKKNEITISARNSYIADFISIKPEKKLSLGYDPAHITYTSVGIGGVTTGNLNFHDESVHVQSEGYTDYWYLNYGDEYCPIYTVSLSDELLQEAKSNSYISQYLSGNKLVFRSSHKKSLSEIEERTIESGLNSGSLKNNVTAMNMLLTDNEKSILSIYDCKRIKKWLAGKSI